MTALLIPILTSAIRHFATLCAGALVTRGAARQRRRRRAGRPDRCALGAFVLSVGSKFLARNKLLASLTGDINAAVASAPADALRSELRAAPSA
jgi:hypothetical protein